MMTLWIFTEGDQQRGLGHLSRCHSYATAWEKLGGKVQWVIDGDSIAHQFINGNNVVWKQWQFEKITISLNMDIAIIDSYAASVTQLKKLSSFFKITAYIDDTFRVKYPKGLVIHPTPNVTKITNNPSRWLIGTSWQPIRPDFIDIRKRNKTLKKTINNILVMMGGTDILGITNRIVDITKDIYPTATIHIITNIQTACSSNCIYYSNLSAKQVAELMYQSDISICAAGQTIFELIASLLPSIIIKTAENQSSQLESISSHNLFEIIDNWENDNIIEKIRTSMSILNDFQTRKNHVVNMSKYPIPDGAQRLSHLLFYYSKMSTAITYRELTLIPFTQLNKSEKITILSIRNRYKVRKEMHDTKRISISSHINFIKSQEQDPCNLNYAVFYENQIMGSTSLHRIDWIKKEAWLDIYRHPSDKWLGFGNKILQAIEYIAFDIANLEKLNLCVKVTNDVAFKLYKKSNFLERGSNEEFLEMELTKNRR
ncbi:UDP-4-amino-4,6-dideoxy-N-acetyl-beta-L-altrosamine N-acetyltransferase [Aeromonas veronii]|uniref:UDP-4-amino-4, 6-dideoxy-N-acetyl-beta-L-altrosamine N-acetyltransferase n=1 Tax=Aeromonas veronii TaxID=654 RepID=UPI001CD7099A|nr:UDP-4-amino-4,6-dideoxy-N-acetyl-beta-L-altrosamine N-acetyltransferase [Aeromonas veronii]UBR46975.1 UDP-4-amino-4,6-dideoxy-N-acetyl-beta-L-altrosamine N-acetyltransferase [Aeromonas veronii]